MIWTTKAKRASRWPSVTTSIFELVNEAVNRCTRAGHGSRTVDASGDFKSRSSKTGRKEAKGGERGTGAVFNDDGMSQAMATIL